MDKVTLTKEQLFKVMHLNEQETKAESKGNSGFKNMVSTLLHSQTQAQLKMKIIKYFIYDSVELVHL